MVGGFKIKVSLKLFFFHNEMFSMTFNAPIFKFPFKNKLNKIK